MSKTITSTLIGVLHQDDRFDDWWVSDPIGIPFFDKQMLPITFIGFSPDDDKTFIEEADQALLDFLKLTKADREALSEPVYKNCMDFLGNVEFDEADDDLRAIKNKNEIWDFVHPTEIYVSRRHPGDKDVYIQIICDCDWEQEHGLQLIFRQGKQLTRVSAQDAI